VRFRKVRIGIWQDPRFLALPDDAKLLLLHHMTSPASTPFFLWLEGLGAISDTLGFSAARMKRATERLATDGMVRYGREGALQWVFLPDALEIEENAPNGVNSVTSYVRLFGDLPATAFRHAAVTHWRSRRIIHRSTLAFLDAICHAFGYAIKDGAPMPSPMASAMATGCRGDSVEVEVEVEGEVEVDASPSARRGPESFQSRRTTTRTGPRPIVDVVANLRALEGRPVAAALVNGNGHAPSGECP